MKHRSSLLYAILPAMPLLLAACGGATATGNGNTALLASNVAAPATTAAATTASTERRISRPGSSARASPRGVSRPARPRSA